MIAVDTSIAIAAFGVWHELHESAGAILDEEPAIPAHALLETYSVLTGFPRPHRAPPGIVRTWLDESFTCILEPPGAEDHRELVGILADAARIGGAVYDGVVAVTARLAGAELVTADRRAVSVYDLVGVRYRLLT